MRDKRVFIVGSGIITLFFLGVAKLLLPRIGAFGCFDDCFNYVAGYFLGQGRRLYSEIFFNHQMIPAYISYFVQVVFSPQTIYELIRKHREILLLWGWGMNIVLFYRFGPAVLGFTAVYELSKYYVFGDRFLAEAFIVYPLVYCAGLLLRKSLGERLTWYDYILSSVFIWFVIFSREPFIPVSIVLFVYIMWSKKYDRVQKISLLLLSVLSFGTLIVHPLRDYFFQVVELNRQSVIKPEQLNIVSIGLYPVLLFLGGTWNVFRLLAVTHSGVFLTVIVLMSTKGKKYGTAFFVLIVLALSNIRTVEPGKIFYEAFHLAPWWGLFIFITWQIVWSIRNKPYGMTVAKVSFVVLVGALLVFVVHPSSYIHDTVDRHAEFTTNYGNDFVYGEIVRLLGDADASLFLDGWDDLIYWQAKKISPYRFGWYTSSMPYFSLFTDARIHMFLTDPPDFYYGSCEKDTSELHVLPSQVRSLYRGFLFSRKPTCLYILSSVLSKIPSERLQTIEQYNFSIER